MNSSEAHSHSSVQTILSGTSPNQESHIGNAAALSSVENSPKFSDKNKPISHDEIVLTVDQHPLSGGPAVIASNTLTSKIEVDPIKSPTLNLTSRTNFLPWGNQSRTSTASMQAASSTVPSATVNSIDIFLYGDASLRPGEIVMRTLFHNFTQQAEKKIELVMLETLDKNLAKLLQRGENPAFDQLLSALGSVAEHCLPSLLRALLAWHTRQISDTEIRKLDNAAKHGSPELESQVQRREAAVEFIFCLALLEVLKQLHFHPGHEDLIRRIEHLAFRHFKFRDGIQNTPNAHNIHMIADLYAEVIGVLAQSRFQSVSRKYFI